MSFHGKIDVEKIEALNRAYDDWARRQPRGTCLSCNGTGTIFVSNEFTGSKWEAPCPDCFSWPAPPFTQADRERLFAEVAPCNEATR